MSVIGASGLVVLGLVFVGVLLSVPTMLLWNALLPSLFGFPELTFWQALGMCLLARFLFGAGNSSKS